MHFQARANAQVSGGADSLVRLVEAVSAHLIEIDSVSYRKVVGPATFLHNNAYLKCDTALWNVNTNIIDAIGNVQILQENTTLTSDRIEYVANENLAKFRGSLVQLYDNQGNVLNTNFLNYNTKDSIATFFGGASLKDGEGKLIESINGMYYSAQKLFTFRDSVQMFADSVFISTSRLDYHTNSDIAYFKENTIAWKDSSILYANSGSFNRPINLFEFNSDGYILTAEQELWADRLMYWRNNGNADLYNNVQVLDTVQRSIAMSDKAYYRPQTSRIELLDNPVVGMYTIENDVADTLFLAADTIFCYTKQMGQIDSLQIMLANERLALSEIDPIAIHDKERREAKKKPSGNTQAPKPVEKFDIKGVKQSGDIEGTKLDSGEKVAVAPDTMMIAVSNDTVKVNFVDAFHNVRFYRNDVQGRCDSLVYTGIDSMARFYSNPVMWQEGKNQFSADSIQAQIKNGKLKKVNMLSNAFIISQEDSVHFNQIKSTEMVAYFAENELKRFDALGGVTALFYMEEDSVITLMDREECKMMTVKFKDNEVQRVRSIGDLKQNVFPVYNLPEEEQKLKGFNWRGEERPVTRFEITDRKLKPSRRAEMIEIEKPKYRFSQKYFPDLTDKILQIMEVKDK